MHDKINSDIKVAKAAGVLDANLISDGHHTFGELYEHRIRLFIALCRICGEDPINKSVWIKPVVDGWFIIGIGRKKGKQISYHLPEKYFEECNDIATPYAPEWDGHSSEDVLERLKNL